MPLVIMAMNFNASIWQEFVHKMLLLTYKTFG
uniref:Uncharacterized protein n=1 Tax=Anguilla anguilla TaxID=7936 RepID=A0A0E9UL49_ANGAN